MIRLHGLAKHWGASDSDPTLSGDNKRREEHHSTDNNPFRPSSHIVLILCIGSVEWHFSSY